MSPLLATMARSYARRAREFSSYSRAQAIDDGFLVDLSAIEPELCREHYKHPIACTAAVWRIIERSLRPSRSHMNDRRGVLHDILWMSRVFKGEGSAKLFRVKIKGAGRQSLFTFKILCGPGDDAAPVLTIMLPEED